MNLEPVISLINGETRPSALAQDASHAIYGYTREGDVAAASLYAALSSYSGGSVYAYGADSVQIGDIVYGLESSEPLRLDGYALGIRSEFRLVAQVEGYREAQNLIQSVDALTAASDVSMIITDSAIEYETNLQAHSAQMMVEVLTLPLDSQSVPVALIYPTAAQPDANREITGWQQTVMREWAVVVVGDDDTHTAGTAIRERLAGKQVDTLSDAIYMSSVDYTVFEDTNISYVKYLYYDYTFLREGRYAL